LVKIATWNINGVKARLESALTWLRDASPDIACFQEIKSVDEQFPAAEFEALGYNVAVHGQKGFNGVALLSRRPFDEVRRGLPGAPEDVQARYIEGVISVPCGVIRVGGLYLPNGNPITTEKFTYKLAWMDRLVAHAQNLLALEETVVLTGDYNVIPHAIDAKRPQDWVNDALAQPQSREAYRRLMTLGYIDGVRACHPEPDVYTFWDYQAGAYQKNNGIRIDHALLSPQAADRLRSAGIDKFTRGWEKPSDHVPVWVELDVG
jgi:exodeoxyribonuclease-3